MHTILMCHSYYGRTTAVVHKILFYVIGMDLIIQNLSGTSHNDKAKLKLLKNENELRCQWGGVVYCNPPPKDIIQMF